jgi:mono/diheme cytochrome c family protein
VLVAAIVIGFIAATQFTLSALPEPGRIETALATRVKHYLVHRSRKGIPPAPADRQASTREGERLFGTECGACHGNSGHNPTDAGRWMYPRAADLTSRESQSYSDQELFWVIKNGIRLSGMPAFGKVESDEHVWDLVFYVRTLPNALPQSRQRISSVKPPGRQRIVQESGGFYANEYRKSILGGLTETMAITLMMYFVLPMMGVRMDIAASLGKMLGGSWALGMTMHFINGTLIFPLIYAFLIYRIFPGQAWAKGIYWGLILWFLAQAVVMPMMGGGFFSANMGGA